MRRFISQGVTPLGWTFSYEGQIHTHPLSGAKGISEFSEDALFAKADKGILVFILHENQNIYGGYYSSKQGGLITWNNSTLYSKSRLMKDKHLLLQTAFKYENK